jgi:hypothetical protein
MLIRSQDKLKIIDFNGGTLHYAPTTRKIRFIASGWNQTNTENEYIDIAEYSTEAKAIKVLDKIQETYETSLYCDHAFDNGAQVMRPYIFVNNRVFQMPSDEEVEG